jgi:2-octaprenyl-6-methoxyphenol hydroxylase
MSGKTTEVAVVGGGPAGLTAAIALASAGVHTTLLARRPQADNRTTALLASSVTALETLGVWSLCADQAAPLRVMRIVDATKRLLRAPEVRFEAAEIGLPAFAYNIENQHLMAALAARAGELPQLHWIEGAVRGLEIAHSSASLLLADDSEIVASLVIGADGRHSLCRKAAGIVSDQQNYPQTALTFNLQHTRPHRDISTEFHTESGPFTLVPLPGSRSSLVWVVSTAEADLLCRLDEQELADKIERHSHSILGKIAIESRPGAFQLGLETARCFAQNRVALIGEAAHALPPIGAQGLNLGLRDAATIGEIAVAARRSGEDLGGPEVLERYDSARRLDVGSRTLAVDFLNRSLLSDFLPLHGARGFALYMMNRIAPLRRALMREGVQPSAAQPRLMLGEML